MLKFSLSSVYPHPGVVHLTNARIYYRPGIPKALVLDNHLSLERQFVFLSAWGPEYEIDKKFYGQNGWVQIDYCPKNINLINYLYEKDNICYISSPQQAS